MGRKRYRTAQLAKLARITPRTLRYYDKIGLVEPSGRSGAGHRIYGEEDLVKLQQVLALKFLGFSLTQIAQLIAVAPHDLGRSLQIQREMMADKREAIDRVIEALDRAQEASAGPDIEAVVEVIQAMGMEQKMDWEKYYSEEQAARLKERQKSYTPEDAERDAKAWDHVIAGFKKAFAEGRDPGETGVQSLAAQWQGLIEAFTEGDSGMTKSLGSFVTSEDNPYKPPLSAKENEFVQKALAILKERRG